MRHLIDLTIPTFSFAISNDELVEVEDLASWGFSSERTSGWTVERSFSRSINKLFATVSSKLKIDFLWFWFSVRTSFDQKRVFSDQIERTQAIFELIGRWGMLLRQMPNMLVKRAKTLFGEGQDLVVRLSTIQLVFLMTFFFRFIISRMLFYQIISRSEKPRFDVFFGRCCVLGVFLNVFAWKPLFLF